MSLVIEKFIQKQVQAMVKVVDDKAMILDHCISDDSFDRVQDDINQDGWDFKNYLRNPVVLDSHDYSKNPIGKCLKLYRQGNQTRAITQFAPTPEGTEKFNLYKDGFLSAFSVGFIPTEYSPNKQGGYHIEKQELLEYSCVTVPCNPNAVKNFLTESNLENEEIGGNEMLELATLIAEGTFEHEGKTYFVSEKAGATLSAKTKEVLSAIQKGITDHCSSLEKLLNQTTDSGNDDDTSGKALRGEIEKELREALEVEYKEKLDSEILRIENEAKDAVQKAIDTYDENFKKSLEKEGTK